MWRSSLQLLISLEKLDSEAWIQTPASFTSGNRSSPLPALLGRDWWQLYQSQGRRWETGSSPTILECHNLETLQGKGWGVCGPGKTGQGRELYGRHWSQLFPDCGPKEWGRGKPAPSPKWNRKGPRCSVWQQKHIEAKIQRTGAWHSAPPVAQEEGGSKALTRGARGSSPSVQPVAFWAAWPGWWGQPTSPWCWGGGGHWAFLRMSPRVRGVGPSVRAGLGCPAEAHEHWVRSSARLGCSGRVWLRGALGRSRCQTSRPPVRSGAVRREDVAGGRVLQDEHPPQVSGQPVQGTPLTKEMLRESPALVQQVRSWVCALGEPGSECACARAARPLAAGSQAPEAAWTRGSVAGSGVAAGLLKSALCRGLVQGDHCTDLPRPGPPPQGAGTGLGSWGQRRCPPPAGALLCGWKSRKARAGWPGSGASEKWLTLGHLCPIKGPHLLLADPSSGDRAA